VLLARPGPGLEDRSAVVLEPLLGTAEKVVVGEGDFRRDETIITDGRDRRDVGVRLILHLAPVDVPPTERQ
jgi:hypothetical protein